MEIEVKNAEKSFGKKNIFKNINLKFEKGNFYLIKGANGSGKTVFLKTLCGYLPLSKGEIIQNGVKIRNKNNYIQNAGIIIENPQFLGHLTLIENLNLLKEMNNNITDDEIDKWIKFYNIEEFKDTKYKNLSLGTKQKLSLIQAFIHNPTVLILDEPFNALDKKSFEKTENYLKNIKENTIIILSTHINDKLKYMSDFEYVFEDQELKFLENK